MGFILLHRRNRGERGHCPVKEKSQVDRMDVQDNRGILSIAFHVTEFRVPGLQKIVTKKALAPGSCTRRATQGGVIQCPSL
jgi:hypothetical protein